ncbi:hypothetical protein EFBL_0962 [Effusibacillus lacus]|uniref:Uncharacterized protein n=1 Tax=Effusibacillus lacus TaxID=1348429 RepID=A0A292YLT4_9BACL|nr:hypothetical protein EFBL_0962 [Effusibacillus lacus]
MPDNGGIRRALLGNSLSSRENKGHSTLFPWSPLAAGDGDSLTRSGRVLVLVVFFPVLFAILPQV